MTKRIFRAICLVVLMASAVLIAVALLGVYDHVAALETQQMEEQITLAVRELEQGTGTDPAALPAGEYRMTWIGADGRVLFDSRADAALMGSHLERQEVREALATGEGRSRRYSSALDDQFIFLARRLPDGTVLRLGCSREQMLAMTLKMLEPLLLAGLAVLALLLVLAAVMAKDIVSPLTRIDLERPLENIKYVELIPLLSCMDSQQTQLKLQEEALRRRQEEFRAATDNLQEGLVLLNEYGAILSANRAAIRLLELGSGFRGRSLTGLRSDLALGGLIARAKAGIHAEQRLELRSGEYQINASPVDAGQVRCGVALLIFDVTEKEKAEQMRREFTANVSHELKTPLHTISGSAELLKSGLVKPEDTARFAGHIYDEAQRLVLLVEDIIRLSHMDEGAVEMQRCQVELLALADKVLKSLRSAAAEAQVTVHLEGAPAAVEGVPQLLEGLLYNLCDNGIKYNRAGGSLTVTVEDRRSAALVTVRDTGIGIPEEHRERIFERFYRVDKSHSKAVGGTGLGLSIVKHAAKLHRAHIALDSRPGEGTAITVTFPKNGAAV